MSAAPPISVVMPVYNSAEFVAEAIESILSQTFRDFEFIIIDDGSTDESGAILRDYAARDNRIRYYAQENCGLIASLNRYCPLAKGRYIARMDADDISLPTRLEKQFRFLENHPEIGILGARIQDVDRFLTVRGTWPVPCDPAVIQWFLMFGNCMAHPSVTMRREVLERAGYYRNEAVHVEDYDLWIRASAISNLANLPEVLLHYRIVDESVSSRNLSRQERQAADLKCALIGSLVQRPVSLDTIDVLGEPAAGLAASQPELVEDAANLLMELFEQYVKKVPLSRGERAEITLDVFRRCWLLGLFARRIPFRKALSVTLRPLRFAPRLFSLRSLQKAMDVGVWAIKSRGRLLTSQRREL